MLTPVARFSPALKQSNRAYFRVVLATLCGLGNLERGLGSLKMWSTFLLSYAASFTEVLLCFGLYMLYANFENRRTCVSM